VVWRCLLQTRVAVSLVTNAEQLWIEKHGKGFGRS
jgi:hypothetical protein